MSLLGSDDEDTTDIERADPSEYIWVCKDCQYIHSAEPEVCLRCSSGRLREHRRENYDTETNPEVSVTEIGGNSDRKSALGVLIQDNTSITLILVFITIILALSAISLLFKPNIIITASVAILLLFVVLGFFVYRFISQ